MESFRDNGEEFHNTVTGIGLSYLIGLIVYDITERRCDLIFFILCTHMHNYNTEYIRMYIYNTRKYILSRLRCDY
jgi:hypothetical protein